MSQLQQRSGSDRRVHHRFEDLRASLVELGENNNGIVLNISEGGMAILAAEDLDLESLRNLRFQAPEFEHWMEIAAEIAWISDSRRQAGIRFKSLSDTARMQLRAGISIATTRARRENEANQTAAPDRRKQEMAPTADSAAATDSAAGSNSPSASDPSLASSTTKTEAVPVAAESNLGPLEFDTALKQGTPQNLITEDKGNENEPRNESRAEDSPHSPAAAPQGLISATERAPNSSMQGARQEPQAQHVATEENDPKEIGAVVNEEIASDARENRLTQNDLKKTATRDEVNFTQSSHNDMRPQPFNLHGAKPQKTSTVLALDAHPSSLAMQKNSLAQLSSRKLFPTSPVQQSGESLEGILNRTNISARKWIVVTAVAICASLLAFFVGWLLGNPHGVRLNH